MTNKVQFAIKNGGQEVDLKFIFFNILGFIGDAFIIAAFFFIQSGRIKAESYAYPLVNLLGATGILLSLIVSFNWPVLVIEIFWIGISLYGLFRAHRLRSA